MNHDGLFIKLMKKTLISYFYWKTGFLMELLASNRGSVMSRFVGLTCGVRQGGILSHYFFAIHYIDSVVKKVSDSKMVAILRGCVWVFCFMLMTYY